VPNELTRARERIDALDVLAAFGAKLGFSVARHDRPAAMLWSSLTGAHLIVTLIDAADAVKQIGRAAALRDAVLASAGAGAPPRDDVFCLYIVRGEPDQRAGEQAAMVRHATAYVRLITSASIASLADLVDRGALTHDAAVTLLRPNRVYADDVVAIVAEQETRVPAVVREQPRAKAQPDSETPPIACPTCGSPAVTVRAGPQQTWCRCSSCGALWWVTTGPPDANSSEADDEDRARLRRGPGEPPKPCGQCGSGLAWAALYAGELVYLQCRECGRLRAIKDRRVAPGRRVPR
jgi:hypothetical protein